MSPSKAKQVQNKIHRQMTIEELLTNYPQKAQRLAQEMTHAGLHCVGCQAATWETLEAGMLGHGMMQKEIDQLVEKLNAILEEEESDAATITLTKKAAIKYLEILDEENKHGWGLRFSEKMAGCNGFEYALEYSEKPLPDDEVFVSEEIEIHINRADVERLLGSEIDFVDVKGLNGSSGFKVTNPNVRSSCGCGTSHGY
ncbi:MAG: iron-sulfur cluster assembly accessory protein [Waddliaceae bacterium]